MLSLLVSFFIIKFQIRKHINDINSSLEALIEKNFDNKLKNDYPKEFIRLADNINKIAETLLKFNTELSKSKVYLEGVVESTSDIIITVNKEGKILTFNSGAEKTPDQIESKNPECPDENQGVFFARDPILHVCHGAPPVPLKYTNDREFTIPSKIRMSTQQYLLSSIPIEAE